MSDFSRLPQDELAASIQKEYVGLYFGQGVPILDRDLNLLQDLISATLRAIIGRYIGDGVPLKSDAFAIQALANPASDFQILAGSSLPGRCLVQGIEVSIRQNVNYTGQAGPPPGLSTPTTGPNPRVDAVYLDVSLAMIDGTTDSALQNAGDVAVQTTVRLRPTWTVRVAEGVQVQDGRPGVPTPRPGHFHFLLARLERALNVAQIRPEMITDLRQTCLTLPDLHRLLVRPAFGPRNAQIRPRSRRPNETIELLGRNFTLGAPRVLFGSTAAAKVEGSFTGLVVTVPSGVAANTKVRMTVITDGGTAVSDDDFTFE
jgi:hypothetical protein